MKKYSIGIDIGGTKCAVILGRAQISEHDYKDFILDRMCFRTEVVKGCAYVIERILDTVYQMIVKHKIEKDEVVGIGISCGGPLDHVKGIVMNPPNLFGWDEVPIVEIVTKRFGIPTFIQNDANACALAEWKFGAAKGCQDVVFLTFGTGMGAGLILNGSLYNGMNNMAGEVGHVRLSKYGPVGFGKAGSFEGFCSGGGIAQMAKMKVLEKIQMGIKPTLCPRMEDVDSITAKSVARAAEEGDELSREIYELCGTYLGAGLSLLIDILNPQVIVIGSIYERANHLLWPSVRAVIEKEALPQSSKHCRVIPAKLGNQIGDYAALSVAFHGGVR